MNKIFSRVWSHAKQAMVVASELASARGKRGGTTEAAAATVGAVLALAGLSVLSAPAFAEKLTLERDGQRCTLRDSQGASRQIDCATFEQFTGTTATAVAATSPPDVGVASVGSDYLRADGMNDGSDLPQVAGEGALAAGAGSYAVANAATAVGGSANAGGLGAPASGNSAMAFGDATIAIGQGAFAGSGSDPFI
ncbi:MAG TPA: ESPR domain-containing protein, partial [Lysobacter sp.]